MDNTDFQVTDEEARGLNFEKSMFEKTRSPQKYNPSFDTRVEKK
jgi:hypothetical protein